MVLFSSEFVGASGLQEGWTAEDDMVFEGLWSSQAPSGNRSDPSTSGAAGMQDDGPPRTGSGSTGSLSQNGSSAKRYSDGSVQGAGALAQVKQRSLAHRAREQRSSAGREAPPLVLVANKRDLAGDPASAQSSLPDNVRTRSELLLRVKLAHTDAGLGRRE